MEAGPKLAARLRPLRRERVCGREVRVAAGFRARLLGLALLSRGLAGAGLLIPSCASVHTFGMRFCLDLIFLDDRGRVLAVHRRVPPWRLVWQRGAAIVLEIPSEEREREVPSEEGGEPSAPGT